MRALVFPVLGMLAMAPSVAWSAAGSLDPTFGDRGRVRTVLDGVSYAQAIVRQPSGHLVVGGSSSSTVNSSRTIVLVRYAADGSVDTSFGEDGIVRTTLDSYPYLRALVLQPDGKLVVVAFSQSGPSNVALLRYDTTGALDPTFGTGGIALPDLGQRVEATAAALQSDGRIVVIADTSNGATDPDGSDVFVYRFDVDGALDGTFGTAGISVVDFAGGRRDDAVALVVQPDDGIVVTGYAWVDPQHLRNGSDVAVARLDATGALDPTFGTGGIVLHGFGKADWPQSLLLLGDGSLLLGGTSNTYDPDEDYFIIDSPGFLLRFTSAGVLDGTYGASGVVWLSPYVDPASLLQGPGGTVVTISTSSTAAFKLAQGIGRRLSDGSADLGFGDGGVVVAQLGAYDGSAAAGLVDPDGNIVAVGWDAEPCDTSFSPYGSCYHFGLARYLGATVTCTSDADCGPCESCGLGGACGFGPRSSCAAPSQATLFIDEPWRRIDKHGVRFQWRGAVPAGFDPQSDDTGLCLYLEGQRALVATAPAGGSCNGAPCWSGPTSSGFSYADRERTPDGVRKINVKPTGVKVLASGRALLETMHGLPHPAIVEQAYGSIRAQVHLGATCVDVDFPHVSTIFKRVERNTFTWTKLRAAVP